MKIIFTNFLDVPEKFSPKPAGKDVPNWYKKLTRGFIDTSPP